MRSIEEGALSEYANPPNAASAPAAVFAPVPPLAMERGSSGVTRLIGVVWSLASQYQSEKSDRLRTKHGVVGSVDTSDDALHEERVKVG